MCRVYAREIQNIYLMSAKLYLSTVPNNKIIYSRFGHIFVALYILQVRRKQYREMHVRRVIKRNTRTGMM